MKMCRRTHWKPPILLFSFLFGNVGKGGKLSFYSSGGKKRMVVDFIRIAELG